MISAFRFAATLVVVSAAMGWFHSPGWAQSPAMPSELPPLRTGDIVFQTSSDDQALAIALASRSSFTHTALVEIDERGSANVVEAAGTVHTTPLAKWIKHGTGGRIVVKRFTGLNEAIARRILKAAHAYDGRTYDDYFYESHDEIYCSELVYLAFKEGAGLDIETGQHVRDLNIDNAPARALIQSRWRGHPLCREKKAKTFDRCYALILDQTLVTPASIARDPKLETVFSNFGTAGE